jgi:ACR3 family arsenite efflux pump ArsB
MPLLHSWRWGGEHRRPLALDGGVVAALFPNPVSISVWGVSSRQALAGVIGPLIEVPVLVARAYLSLWLRPRGQPMG